jgi:hypothetical protein
VRIEQPYNPLDKKNLGVSVAEALLLGAIHPLPPAEQFIGAGIYAIYYKGDFPAYGRLAKLSKDETTKVPIYVGEAIHEGGRKGGMDAQGAAGPAMHRRLSQHAATIQAAKNLKIEDFYCQYLVVEDIWIPLGENMLIERFTPLWNRVVDGFGNHDPGKGRYNQQRSAWDVIHPGRAWAGKCAANARTAKEILAAVEKFLEKI